METSLVFSYWLLAWYFAYITKLTPYNPKLGLILGIIENTIMLFALIIYKTNISFIIKFLLINLFIKIIPLYTIYKQKITIKDVYASIVFFAIYTLWVHVNGKTVYGLLKYSFVSIARGKNKTPAMYTIAKIQKDNF